MTITRAEFEAKLADFIAALDKLQEDHYRKHLTATFNAHGSPKHTLERGPKYIRVVTSQPGHRSVYCFLDYNGNILKAESWKKPAKHVRGNIFDDNFSIGKGLTLYGAAYLK